MKKVYDSAAEALDGALFDGMMIAAGGFGLTKGTAIQLLEAGVDVITSGNHIWHHKDVAARAAWS